MAAPVILTAAQAVAAVPESINDPETVKAVQKKLLALGYVDIGAVDGDAGQLTQDQILAFRARNDLPLVPVIDSDFMMALAVAVPKFIPIEIATATVEHVSERVAVVRTNWWTRLYAKILGLPAGALTLAAVIIDNVGDASGKLQMVKALLGDVPLWVWGLLLVVVAWLIGRSANKVETAVVQGYQQGTVKNDAASNIVDAPPSGQLVEAKTNDKLS